MATTVDFGLMLQPTSTQAPASELFAYNRRLLGIASQGFSGLWAEDHLQWGDKATLESMTTLSYLAAEFPHLGVGSLVLGQSYRNPALLAKMAANLQMFSGGRFTLGLGAGWKEDEYRAYGYAYPSVKTRLGELEEAAIIIKQLWAGGPVTFEGTHYQVHNAYCQPRPEPAIPLLIGGGGEQKTLAIVARHADWWNFNSCSLDTYARKVALLKAHCQRIGRDFEEIRLTYLSTVSVSEQPDEVVRSAEKHFVAGNSEEVTRELEQFRELGVSYFIFRFLDPASLERFVQTVLPRFAGER